MVRTHAHFDKTINYINLWNVDSVKKIMSKSIYHKHYRFFFQYQAQHFPDVSHLRSNRFMLYKKSGELVFIIVENLVASVSTLVKFIGILRVGELLHHWNDVCWPAEMLWVFVWNACMHACLLFLIIIDFFRFNFFCIIVVCLRLLQRYVISRLHFYVFIRISFISHKYFHFSLLKVI